MLVYCSYFSSVWKENRTTLPTASHRIWLPACKHPARKKRAAQEARTVPGDGGDAATRKETTPPSTGPGKARKEDGEVGCTDCEGNGPEKAMETEPSPT